MTKSKDTSCIQVVKRMYLGIYIFTSGLTKHFKLKLSENAKGNFQVNQESQYASRLSKRHVCNISRTVKVIRLKISGNVELKYTVHPSCQKGVSPMTQERLRL